MDNTTGPGRKRTREDQSDYYGGGKVVRMKCQFDLCDNVVTSETETDKNVF